MSYQIPAPRLAPASGTFREAVARAAGVALTAPGLCDSDRQLMYDIRRQESARYRFAAVDRMLDLLATIPDESSALALVEELRGAILARRRRLQSRPVVPRAITSALIEEEIAAAAAIVATTRCLTEGEDDVHLRAAIKATSREHDAVEQLLESLQVRRLRLVQGGAA